LLKEEYKKHVAEARQFFYESMLLRSIDELRQRRFGDRFDLIMSCGIMRHLFFDGGRSLLHLVNKKYRIKIKVKVKKQEKHDDFETLWFISLKQHPEDDQNLYVEQTIHKFLSTRICRYIKHVYTLEDIIKYTANIMGAIHSGIGGTDKEQFFLDLMFRLVPFADKIFFFELTTAIEIICESLKPLEELIKSERTPTGGL